MNSPAASDVSSLKLMRPRQLMAYALLALPLAMVALPIYMFVPQFYAKGGLSLTWVGAVLLLVRLMAAFIDPLLGSWIERGQNAYHRFIALSLPLLMLGFIALFHPPALARVGEPGLALWFVLSLSVLYLGFGLATIAHQSWGAALAPQPGLRTRMVGAREGCALLGVILAASLSGLRQPDYLTLAFCLLLALAAACLLAQPAFRLGPPAAISEPNLDPPLSPLLHQTPLLNQWRLPFQSNGFRALFAVLLVNGVASAVPATLFMFFVSDHLQAASHAPLFLLLFFGAAACSIALWVRLAQRLGEVRAWMLGMLWSGLVGVWACALPAGGMVGIIGFAVICVLAGLALGADLALPAALLTGVIGAAGHAGRHEAAYFGVWNWGQQMTLALAAGISLPLLAWCGYTPGQLQASGNSSLLFAYALLPCIVKLLAASILWRYLLKRGRV